METLMTRKEVAAYLNVSLSTFEKKIQSLIPMIKIGNIIRYRKVDVDKFVQEKSSVGV